MMVKRFLSVSKDIIHSSVHDSIGEKVGKISDVLIDPDDSQPKIVILSEGGLLGLGSDHFALPFHLLRFNTNSSDVALQVEKKHVQESPKLDLEKLRSNDKQEIEKLINFYGTSTFSHRDRQNVDSNEYVNERHSAYHHQSYEGSAKVTGEEPKTSPDNPADNMDYEQLKRGKH